MTAICPWCGARNCFLERRHCGPARSWWTICVACSGYVYALGHQTPAKHLRYFLWRVAEFGWWDA